MKNRDKVSVNFQSNNTSDSILFLGFFILLGTYVIEGPLRYVFLLSGHPNLIYIRDGIAVFSIAYIYLRGIISNNWIDPNISIILCMLFLHFIIGLMWGLPLFQVLFGFKIFVSLLFGVAINPILQNRFSDVLLILAFFFIITVSGVFYNYFVQKFPWEGINYETAFGTVSGTKEWWVYGGIRRLPGFARASFDAAMIAGITGLACLILFKNQFICLLIAIICFTAIILTTSKGMVLAFLFLSFWFTFKNSQIFLPLGLILVFTLLTASIAIPVTSVYFDFGNFYKTNEIPQPLSSLWDRFSWMWPDAFELLSTPEQYILGRGLGSIGTPQSFGLDLRHLNSADNIFVYLFIMFGPLALLYLIYPAWQTLRYSGHDDFSVWRIGFLIICYGYGLTTNMLEQSFFCCLLGMTLGYSLRNRKI